METASRVLRIITLALWVGGLVFFAFAVAPVAFHVLPTTHEAGTVVAGCLRILHWIGLVCGGLFLLASLTPATRSASRGLQITLLCSMLAITCVSQFVILPRMEVDRAAANGAIDSVAPDAPPRVDFDRLHHLSERLEGAVLLCGLVALALAAAQSTGSRFTER